ncbi:hypothetical protein [Staphylothermus marinus]|nr:hypothetical protein [Staphylothermus marinus]
MNGLYWEGEINGIYIVIDASFPNVGEIYEAWGEPVGYCHAHVWWVKE